MNAGEETGAADQLIEQETINGSEILKILDIPELSEA